MSLSSGTRLGPYQIVASLGRGGMGEVFEAVDTRLDRRVAIKTCGPSSSPINRPGGASSAKRAPSRA